MDIVLMHAGQKEEEDSDTETEEALSQLSELSFNPTQGIESDDDNDGCCHWSTTQEDQETVALDTEENYHYGKNATAFDDGTSPGDIVLQILNDEWVDICIDVEFNSKSVDLASCSNS